MIITAIDSNILIDVLFEDSKFIHSSAAALTRTSAPGTVVVSAVVMAEIAGYSPHAEAAHKFFRQIDLTITSFDAQGAIPAGQLWRQRMHKDRIRILPDYIVASHAVEYADRLLTRDAEFTRMKMRGLVVVTPTDVLGGDSQLIYGSTTYFLRWNTDFMPTLKPRIQVTETPELAQALALAQEMWPGESKSALVCRLAELGPQSAIEAQTLRMLAVQETQKYVRSHLAGVYKGVSVADLRHMWERGAS